MLFTTNYLPILLLDCQCVRVSEPNQRLVWVQIWLQLYLHSLHHHGQKHCGRGPTFPGQGLGSEQSLQSVHLCRAELPSLHTLEEFYLLFWLTTNLGAFSLFPSSIIQFSALWVISFLPLRQMLPLEASVVTKRWPGDQQRDHTQSSPGFPQPLEDPRCRTVNARRPMRDSLGS